MAELLAKVSSFEGIMAAVQNGADAVIFAFDYMAAGYRRSELELRRAAGYCRVRDVRLYVSIEDFPREDEFSEVIEYGRLAWRLGAHAAVLSDTGVCKALRTAVPDMPLQAGTRMAIFDTDGLKAARAMGFYRAYLPKEMTREEIFAAAAAAPIEVAVTVQGDMCSSIEGFCHMSSHLGGVSEMRLNCNRACRYQYTMVGCRNDYPLSLKDNCLIRHLGELEKHGVSSFVINCDYKLPEYAAIVTNVYYNYIHCDGQMTMYDCLSALKKAYPGRELTDNGYLGRGGDGMIGDADCDMSENIDYIMAHKDYRSREFARVPVNFVAIIKKGEPIELAAGDNKGNIVSVRGEIPPEYGKTEIRRATVLNCCRLTGKTPYLCNEVRTVIDKGLYTSGHDFGMLVKEVLSLLTEKRMEFSERSVYSHYTPDIVPNREEPPDITVSVSSLEQLSEELLELKPKILYVPIEIIKADSEILNKFILSRDTAVCAVLPGIIRPSEREKLGKMTETAKALGINEVAVSSIGHAMFARQYRMAFRGDFGLNVYNGAAVDICKKMGFRSVIISPETTLENIKTMPKTTECELMAYGRVRLMYTGGCIIRDNTGLCSCDDFEKITSEKGEAFHIKSEFGCRNTIYSSKKLYIGDKEEDYTKCGLFAVRLCFTTEKQGECVKIMKKFRGIGNYEPTFYTHGMYYRGARKQ